MTIQLVDVNRSKQFLLLRLIFAYSNRFYSGLRDINFTHTSCTSYFATVKYKAKLRTCDAPKIPYFNKNAILHESKYMKWTS